MTKDSEVLECEGNQVSQEPIPQQKEERIELNTQIENVFVSQVRDWAVQKIELLHEADRHRNAKALAAEFDEWINIPEDVEELDYLCIENDLWVDDQKTD